MGKVHDYTLEWSIARILQNGGGERNDKVHRLICLGTGKPEYIFLE